MICSACLLVLALTTDLSPEVFSGRAAGGPATADAGVVPPLLPSASRLRAPAGSGRRHQAQASCQPRNRADGYVNPLAYARVKGERIDQGVDYAGVGALTALGPAKVVRVATMNSGWPGAFIEYRLTGGPSAGCYVYYAEGVQPVRGLHAGQSLAPGQRTATIIPGWSTGIELGWGAGANGETYAAKHCGWNPGDDARNVATAAGRSFSALIGALGGPRGKVEG
jgi:hypothetical protein